jgi:methyl-accepting chemotaxis protein
VKWEKIGVSDEAAAKEIANICGEVTIGCAETAILVTHAIDLASKMADGNSQIFDISETVDAEIGRVSLATHDAKELAKKAQIQLEDGNEVIQISKNSFTALIALVRDLSAHVTSFGAAMEQVRRVSADIDSIARTTNMLALNAAIEAQKAGESGRSFAVVAAEVKSLASDARVAATEITITVNSLTTETSSLVAKMTDGIATSDSAQAGLDELDNMIRAVTRITADVGKLNTEIDESAKQLHEKQRVASDLRKNLNEVNHMMRDKLQTAHNQISHLDLRASAMFNHIVHAGLSEVDQPFVEYAIKKGREAEEMLYSALANGSLTMEAIFDRNYKQIEGSNPPRYRNGLSAWADANWRPFLDNVPKENPLVDGAICSGEDGYLPTHVTRFSEVPNGDFEHDKNWCRNGIILKSGVDFPAKASNDPYTMAVYCHEGGVGTTYRSVYVPIRVNGRRWGDFELVYAL